MKYLHIHCGDCSADSLRKSEVPGEILVWHDPVLEGPTPAILSDDEYRRLRAQHFVSQQYVKDFDNALSGLEECEKTLECLADFNEVILWFDACLFDQSIMVRIMDKLTKVGKDDCKISLICIGEFPGFTRFKGLGELGPEQMASLFPSRKEITPEQFALASKAWNALGSDNPRDLKKLLSEDCSSLKYLADAIQRRLEMFPSVNNGLNRMQQAALTAIADGIHDLIGIFKAVSDMEPRPFFGDIMLWECLQEMADAKNPLLIITGPGSIKQPLWEPLQDLKRWQVEITETGREVLVGKLDWIEINGLDKWFGAVHLKAGENIWRWDGDKKHLKKT